MKRLINFKVFEGNANEIKEGEILVTKNNNLGGVLAIEQRIEGIMKDVFTHLPIPEKFSKLPNKATMTALPATIKEEDITNFCSLMPNVNGGVSTGYNMLPYNTCAYWYEESDDSNTILTIECHSVLEDLIIEATFTKDKYVSGTYTKQ